MKQSIKRRIIEVLNYETGECINADEFFLKPLDELTVIRSELQKAIEGFREPLFTCYYCKQKIRIRGGVSKNNEKRSEVFHFAHLKDSPDCHIKTNNILTKDEVNRIKYNGSKESPLHQTLKNQIADCLILNEETKHEISNVEIEKVIHDKVEKEWKKPDINAYFLKNHIAIEFQLSTTWIDVITRRQQFYKENSIFIFWIFHTFDTNDDVRKLTFNDVIYTNNQNAFIFDKEAYELSLAEKDLILKCCYKSYYRIYTELDERWEWSLIKLSDLTFDEQCYRIYYHNSEEQKQKVEIEISEYKSQLEIKERTRILQEQETEKKRREKKREIEDLKDDITSINLYIKELIVKSDNTDKELKNKKLYFENSIDYSEKIVKYLTKNSFSYDPFYHETLFEELEKEFSEQLNTSNKTINEKNEKLESLNTYITSISRLKKSIIFDKSYSQISSSKSWDYIKQNYKQIKVINQHFIDNLFVLDYLKDIKNEFELAQFQYSKDNIFLMDFSESILETNNQIKTNQNIVLEHEEKIVEIKEKIKNRIEINFQIIVSELEIKLINYSNKISELGNEITNIKQELAKIDLNNYC